MADLPSGTVTFLFTDIEGSTRLLQELGPGYPEVLDRHGRILRDAIAAGDGVEVNTEGDSFFAVFATPAGALRAAVEAQRAMAGQAWPDGRHVRVRMALHTGIGQLGGRDYVGLDVHRAARIGAAGHGGQVLVSEATRALVEPALPGGVSLRDLGVHRLKDLERPERLYQLAIDGLAQDYPPLRTLDARWTNLPRQRTSFVGRETEITEVVRLLETHRLVTLTGPGGTGKTRLAIEVAERLVDRVSGGVSFVDLEAVLDAGLVASSIAASLRLREEPGREVLETVAEHLRGRPLLLVLDNFEQVASAGSDVVRLLDEAPDLRVLVTSRVRLHISAEQEYPVAPLPLPDARGGLDLPTLAASAAISLLVQRTAALQPGFGLTAENAGPLAAVAARLDGLPLAIELAASRLKVLSPAALLARLDQRLPLLTGGPRDAPERQRTLRAAIEWSWELLPGDEQLLFARLGAFSRGCSLAAAEAVCQPGLDRPVLDGLAALVDQSLVHEDRSVEDEVRFGMLEVIAEFAAEQLGRTKDEHQLRDRHAEYFARLAEEAEAELRGSDRIVWLARLDADLGNVRAALDWLARGDDQGTGLRIATAMWRYWQQRGGLDEARRRLDRFMRPADARDDAASVRGLDALGGVAYWQHDYGSMREAYETAVRIARRLDDPALLGRALYNASFISAIEHDAIRSRALLDEALANAEQAGDRGLAAEIMSADGFTRVMTSGPAAGIEPLSAAIQIQRDLGNDALVSDLLTGLGGLERRTGHLESATRHLGEALTRAADARDPGPASGALWLLALVANEEGKPERAARLIGASMRRRDEGAPVPPAELIASMGDPEIDARQSLGDAAYEAAYAAGYWMTLDEAVSFAVTAPSA